MSTEQPTIIYTLTDEAPRLATAAFLPIVRSFTAAAGIHVVASDISVAARVLGEFPEFLRDDQKVPNTLAELGKKTLSPDVSTRPRGVVEKCTFCHHRLFQARENARLKGRDPSNLQDGEYITACAKGCPNGAILFGDLNNPKHRVHALAKSKFAFRLLERLGADPQVYYISRREWVQRMSESALNQEAVDGGNDSQD